MSAISGKTPLSSWPFRESEPVDATYGTRYLGQKPRTRSFQCPVRIAGTVCMTSWSRLNPTSAAMKATSRHRLMVKANPGADSEQERRRQDQRPQPQQCKTHHDADRHRGQDKQPCRRFAYTEPAFSFGMEAFLLRYRTELKPHASPRVGP